MPYSFTRPQEIHLQQSHYSKQATKSTESTELTDMIPAPAQLLQVLAASSNDMLDRFVVWESKTVPGTFGLYAKRRLRKGSYLGLYTGRVFPTLRKLLRKNPHTAYALERRSNKQREFVDGDYMLYPDAACILSLINGTRTVHRADALISMTGKIVVKSTITPGQEILLCYGDEYFRECVLPNGDKKIRFLSRAKRTLTFDELEGAKAWTDARSSASRRLTATTPSSQAAHEAQHTSEAGAQAGSEELAGAA